MAKFNEWFSLEGLANRAAGVNKKESKRRKVKLCLFWVICAVVWIILGLMHFGRFNNAMAINAAFKDFKDTAFKDFKDTLEYRSNINSNALLYQADLAYDSCQIPYYKLDPSIRLERYIDTVASYYDECGSNS